MALSGHFRQCIALFAVAEGLLLLDIGLFVLFLLSSPSNSPELPFATNIEVCQVCVHRCVFSNYFTKFEILVSSMKIRQSLNSGFFVSKY